MKRLFLLLFVCLFLTASSEIQAAGFEFYEQGSKATGMGGAFVAQADDASAIAYNPAGIAFLKRPQLYLEGTLTTPTATFHGANPFPGTSVTWDMKSQIFIPPNVSFVSPLGSRLSFGIGVYAPFGLGTEWTDPSAFPGRFISTKADIKAIDINPVIAVRLNDMISLGGGVDIRSATVKLRRDVPLINPFTFQVIDIASLSLDSDRNWGTGFNAGVLAKSKSFSFGLSYRHKIDLDQTGSASFQTHATGNPVLDFVISHTIPTGSLPVKATINYPALLNMGIATNHFEHWTFEFDADWASWSNVKSLSIDFPDNPAFSTSVVENWEDSWAFRAGAERRFSADRYAFRAGYVYDQSPVPPESIDPILPDANRHGICFGFGARLGKLQLDFSDMILLFSKADTNGTSLRGFDGHYNNFANLFGIGATIHF